MDRQLLPDRLTHGVVYDGILGGIYIYIFGDFRSVAESP
jgi:hypothetical protein